MDKIIKKIEVIIVGLTNSGKSTLINQIMEDESICIVSSKPHTTRDLTLGSFLYKDVHLILFDTPGLNSSKKKEIKNISDVAKKSIFGKDLCLMMFDCYKGLPNFLIDFAQSIKENNIPIICILNKIDKVPRNKLLPTIEYLQKYFDKIIPISALKGINIEEVLDDIVSHANKINDQNVFTTNISDERRITERTKEVLFELFDDEIPYKCIVSIDDIQVKNNDISIYESIEVSSSQYPILINRIKDISMTTRQKLTNILCNKHSFTSLKMVPIPEKINKVNLFINIVKRKVST